MLEIFKINMLLCINNNPSFYHYELILPGLSLFSKATIALHIDINNTIELQWFFTIC